MKRNFLMMTLLGAVAFSSSATVFANDMVAEQEAAAAAAAERAAARLDGKNITEEDRQRIMSRMNATAEDKQRLNEKIQNLTPEERARLDERFAAVEEAAKAQASKDSEGADEGNPACKVVVCMFGKMSGNSQSECKSAEREYFSIVNKKRGKIRWSRTAKERLDYLNSCPSPENDKINDMFGKVAG